MVTIYENTIKAIPVFTDETETSPATSGLYYSKRKKLKPNSVVTSSELEIIKSVSNSGIKKNKKKMEIMKNQKKDKTMTYSGNETQKYLFKADIFTVNTFSYVIESSIPILRKLDKGYLDYTTSKGLSKSGTRKCSKARVSPSKKELSSERKKIKEVTRAIYAQRDLKYHPESWMSVPMHHEVGEESQNFLTNLVERLVSAMGEGVNLNLNPFGTISETLKKVADYLASCMTEVRDWFQFCLELLGTFSSGVYETISQALQSFWFGEDIIGEPEEFKPEWGLGDLFSASASAILYKKILGDFVDDNDWKRLSNELSGVKSLGLGLNAMFDYVVSVLTMIRDFLSSYVQMPRLKFLESGYEELDHCFAEFEEIRASIRNKEATNSDFVYRVFELERRFEEFLWTKNDRIDSPARERISYFLQMLKSMVKNSEIECFTEAGSRVEPLTVLIYGETGVGKSTTTKPLVLEMLPSFLNEGELEYYMEDSDRYIHFRGFENQYWDGYKSTTKVIVYDDFGQLKDLPGTPNPEVFELIRLKNTAPFHLHMAAMEQKSNSYARPHMVLCSTNLRELKFHSIVKPTAVNRRFDVAVIQVPKEQYCRRNAAGKVPANIGERKLDQSLIPAGKNFDEEVMEFYHWDTYNGCLAEPHIPLTYRQFVDLLKVTDAKLKSKGDGLLQEQKAIKMRALAERKARDESSLVEFEDKYEAQSGLFSIFGRLSGPKLVSRYPRVIQSGPYKGGVCVSQNLGGQFVPSVKGPITHYMMTRRDRHEVLGVRKIFLDQMLSLNPDCLKSAKVELLTLGVNTLSNLVKKGYHSSVDEGNLALMFSVAWEQGMDLLNLTDENKLFLLEFISDPECDSYIPTSEDPFYLAPDDDPAYKSWDKGWGAESTGPVPYLDTKPAADFPYMVIFDHFSWGAAAKALITGAFAIFLRKKVTPKYDRVVATLKYAFIGVTSIAALYAVGRFVYRQFNPGTEPEAYGVTAPKNRSQRVRDWKAKKNLQNKQGKENPKDRELARDLEKDLGLRLTYKPEAGSQSTEFLASMIKTNLRMLFMDGKQVGAALFIKGRIFVVPLHFMTGIASVDGDPLLEFKAFRGDNVLFACRFSQVDCSYPPGEEPHVDYCFCKINLASVMSHKDITNSFVTEDQLARHDMKIHLYVPLVRSNEIYVMDSMAKIDVGEYEDDNCQYQCVGYKYNVATQVGDCGSPLIIADTSLQKPTIMGIHVAGSRGSYVTSKACLGSRITQEMITESCFEFLSVSEQSDDEIVDDEIEADPLDYKVEGFTGLAKLPVQRFATRTKLSPSKFSGKWGPPLTRPAYLSPFFVEGVRIDPHEVSRSRYAHSEVLVDERLFHDIKSEMVGLLYGQPHESPWSPRLFEYEEAVQGIPNHDYCGGINRSKSPGWPLCLDKKKPGKGDWFGTEGPFQFSSDKAKAFRIELDTVLQKAKKGIRCMHVFQDFLKDEKRPHDKAMAGKTRPVSGGPMCLLVLSKMYFGDFVRHMQVGRIFNGSGIGVDVHTEWDMFARHMCPNKSYKFTAGDYSGFDGKIPTQVGSWVLELIELYYCNSTPEDRLVRKVLFQEVMYSRHLTRDGILIQWTGGNPSGNFLTTVYNTIANLCIIYTSAYAELRERDTDITVRDLFVDSRAEAYGDDALIGYAQKVAEFFSQSTLTKQIDSLYNMKFTAEDKSDDIKLGRDLTEVTFLKRGFRMSEVGVWVAPLSLDTLYETLYWVKQTSTQNELHLRIECVLTELSRHGPEVWAKLGPQIIAASREEYCYFPKNCTYRICMESTEYLLD